MVPAAHAHVTHQIVIEYDWDTPLNALPQQSMTRSAHDEVNRRHGDHAAEALKAVR
jgi:hypothetical protein